MELEGAEVKDETCETDNKQLQQKCTCVAEDQQELIASHASTSNQEKGIEEKHKEAELEKTEGERENASSRKLLAKGCLSEASTKESVCETETGDHPEDGQKTVQIAGQALAESGENLAAKNDDTEKVEHKNVDCDVEEEFQSLNLVKEESEGVSKEATSTVIQGQNVVKNEDGASPELPLDTSSHLLIAKGIVSNTDNDVQEHSAVYEGHGNSSSQTNMDEFQGQTAQRDEDVQEKTKERTLEDKDTPSNDRVVGGLMVDTGAPSEIRRDSEVRRDSIERLVGQDEMWSYKCHFNWSRDRITNIDIDRQIDKWERKKEQDQIRFTSQEDMHSLIMAMAFWYCEKKNYSKANELIKTAEDLCSDFPGKLHVCLANKSFISLRAGRLKEAFETKERVPKYEDLDDKNKAFISCMKGDFERHLSTGSVSNALKHYRRATRLDPNSSLWNIKAGTALAQMRRSNQEMVSEEELSFMLRAAQLGGFSLQLAITLQDMATELYNSPFTGETEAFEINKQLLKVYTSLTQKGNLSAEAFTQCAKGLANLPEPLKDEALAEECFKNALKQCPHCFRANLAYAQFLEFNVGRPKEALGFYETALTNGENYKFFIIPHIIRIRTEVDPSYNPEFEWQAYFLSAPNSSAKVKEFRNNAEYIWKVEPKRALDFYYRAASIEQQLEAYPQTRRSFPWEMQEDGVRTRVSSEHIYYELEDRIALLENHLKLQSELERLHAMEQMRHYTM